jgi:hypothetical protein
MLVLTALSSGSKLLCAANRLLLPTIQKPDRTESLSGFGRRNVSGILSGC